MCMFGGCSLNVIAAQKYENAQDTYAKEMVGVYLSGTDYETLEGVSLSEAVNLYDLESGAKYGSEYIAFYDESIVGLLYVANNEGEFYSSWRNGPFEGLQRLVKDSSEFAIGLQTKMVWLPIVITLFTICILVKRFAKILIFINQ